MPELKDYQEMFFNQEYILAFKRVPDQKTLNEIKQLIEGIEQTNKEFPVAYG